jgi:hypothetical protein
VIRLIQPIKVPLSLGRAQVFDHPSVPVQAGADCSDSVERRCFV